MRFLARFAALVCLLAGVLSTAACSPEKIGGTVIVPVDTISGPRCIFNAQIAMSSKACVPGPEFISAGYEARPGEIDFPQYHDSTTTMLFSNIGTMRLPLMVVRRADGSRVVVPDAWVAWVASDPLLKTLWTLDGVWALNVAGSGAARATYDRFTAPPLNFRLLPPP